MLGVAAALLAELDGATHVLVYGELFGGGYPHPEVPEVLGRNLRYWELND